MKIRLRTLARSAASRLAIAVFAFLGATQAAQASVIFAGHEYEAVLLEGATWDAARAAALALGPGWDLATIGSAPENTAVEGLLGTAYADRSHFWIGATDLAVEGTFQWIDATSFSFTDWWAGEPNNVGEEDWLAYDLRSGLWAWNDLSQNNLDNLRLVRGFVAERELERVAPEPATLFLVGIGALAAGLRRRRG